MQQVHQVLEVQLDNTDCLSSGVLLRQKTALAEMSTQWLKYIASLLHGWEAPAAHF